VGAVGLSALLLASCGLGPGQAPGGVQLTVTREFGAHAMRSFAAPRVHGQETVMSLLMRNATVRTRYGGGFVQSIDGRSGGEAGGEPVDWFYYVNGVEAGRGAAATNVHAGDRIWWDLHDWSQTEDIPAVVGSFPEPFVHGVGGRRLPVRVECAQLEGEACRTVALRLRAVGVPVALAAVGPGDEPETLRVMVGPWSAIAASPTGQSIESGPKASGVYARFAPDGQTLTVLDPRGRVARTLTAGAGLVAATAASGEDPVWLVTGTDEAGAGLAARALSPGPLHDRFALALSAAGATPVPAGGP